jgi:myo-inositol-1(or 4)-monophosphatase
MHPMLNIAVRAARKAGSIINRSTLDGSGLEVRAKRPNDFVTKVDHAAEAAILEIVRKSYPDHAVLAEESGAAEGKAEYQWIIDPLDGTTNFIHGIPHFAVSIACEYRGQIEHAVVLDPIRLEEFTASRGRGAQVNGRRIRVSERKNLDGALIGTGIPFKSRCEAEIPSYVHSLQSVAEKTAGLRRAGAATLDLAYVAAGRLDAFWEMGLAPWDLAAGSLLIREAGGLISDFKGGNDYMDSGNIVCGNPKCFKGLLQLIQPHLGHL